jgi:hypothetical protein
VEFDEAVDVLRGLAGQDVILLVRTPDWRPWERPFRGPLRCERSTEDFAMFGVEEPEDPRWANPKGAGFALSRDAFVSAERCGGPGELGLTVLQGEVRLSIYPAFAPSP